MSDFIKNDDYQNIYKAMLEALRCDLVEEKTAITSAKKITDVIWSLSLMLNTGSRKLSNTIKAVSDVVENRFGWRNA